jgi:DNA-binding transcriptional MerR regulator
MPSDQRLSMAQESAPKKLFRIGEVSQLTGVNPHILRYWESEFQILAPNRRLSKQRLYRQADIDLILTIKRLLEVEKYTLSGVKHYLAAHFALREELGTPPPAEARPSPTASQPENILKLVRKELRAIRKILE